MQLLGWTVILVTPLEEDFERELSEALGRKVDLLTAGALSPHLRERILNEMRVVYGER